MLKPLTHIPFYLEPRSDILIGNHFEIINNGNDDISCVIYYLAKDKCKIILRRLDEECGWQNNIIIKIYPEQGNGDIYYYSAGSSEINYKIINAFIPSNKLKIFPYHPPKRQIPKLIIQTFKDNEFRSILHFNAVCTLIERNPHFEYYFFDDTKSREFISQHFDESVIQAYDKLVPGAYKADLFRYCFLFIKGGCYFDNKFIVRKKCEDWIGENDNQIFIKDRGNDIIYNAIIFSVPRFHVLHSLIQDIVRHVNEQYYGKIPLSPTGPHLVFRYIRYITVPYKHVGTNAGYRESKVVRKDNEEEMANTHYKGYYYNPKQRNEAEVYGNLWNIRCIYYVNKSTSGDYIMYVYPHHTRDSFELIENNNSLWVKRTDSNGGWGQNLRIVLINNKTHQSKRIDVGPSNENVAYIKLE